MRSTSFGSLASLTLPWPIDFRCEVMHFTGEGKPHKNPQDELALLVAGKGSVMVGEDLIEAVPGEFVVVPAGTTHWMIPDADNSMFMFIAYRSKQ